MEQEEKEEEKKISLYLLWVLELRISLSLYHVLYCVTGVFCGLRIYMRDRQEQGLSTCDRVFSKRRRQCICSTLLNVFESQTLYYEFWINLSFGRLWNSGDLLERHVWSSPVSLALEKCVGDEGENWNVNIWVSFLFWSSFYFLARCLCRFLPPLFGPCLAID